SSSELVGTDSSSIGVRVPSRCCPQVHTSRPRSSRSGGQRIRLGGVNATPPFAPLLETDVDPSPLVQFDRWYDFARALPVPHPDAATLATCTRDGIPAARMVLLKGRDRAGLLFFTNYESQKARELAENPRACLVLFWPTLDRQIRVVGAVGKVTREESEAYFATRHRGSQIAAWASQQDKVLASRDELDQNVAE